MNHYQDDTFKKIRKNFLITQSQADAIQDEQRSRGISQSELIRKALDFYFGKVGSITNGRDRKPK